MEEVKLRDYTKEATVQYHECDFRNDIKLSTLLKYAQQVAMEHCDSLGIGHDAMLAIDRVFLMAKVRGRITRLPKAGERLRVQTIPFAPMRAQYQRLIHFYDERGERVVTIDSRWLLVDTKTKRIARKMPEVLEGWFNPPEALEDFRMPKVEEMEEAQPIQVRYSQIDVNRHMNNTVYADLMADCLEKEIMTGEESPVKTFSIVYHSEAKMRETLLLYKKHTEEGWFIRGEKADGGCFEALLELK